MYRLQNCDDPASVSVLGASDLLSEPRITFFSRASFDLKFSETFNAVALLETQPTLPLLRNNILVDLHNLLDRVEKCLWGQVAQTVTVLPYPLMFLTQLQDGIVYLLSDTQRVKIMCSDVTKIIVFNSIKMTRLHYRLRNLMYLRLFCKFISFLRVSRNKFSVGLQESRYSLIFRSVTEVYSMLLGQKLNLVKGLNYNFKRFLELKDCAKSSMLRAFSRYINSWKPGMSNNNLKTCIATFMGGGIFEHAVQNTKTQSEARVSYAWRTILNTYIRNSKSIDINIDIQSRNTINPDSVTFEIPDQIKCMSQAMFVSFFGTLVQHFTEIINIYEGLLKEMRLAIREIIFEMGKCEANKALDQTPSVEEVLHSVDCVMDNLLDVTIKILNDLFLCRKSRNTSVNLSDMKILWDIMDAFISECHIKKSASTMILRQTVKSQLHTLLEGFHDRNTAWLLQSLEAENWSVCPIPENTMAFVFRLYTDTDCHYDEKSMKFNLGRQSFCLTKSMNILIHMVSMHVYFLKSFAIIGSEVIGRLLIILNIHENRCRQLVLTGNFNFDKQYSKKLLYMYQNISFLVLFLQLLASFVYTDEFDGCFRQASVVWDNVISRNIDLKVTIFEKISKNLVDFIEFNDIQAFTSSGTMDERVLACLNARKIICTISSEYEATKRVLSDDEVSDLFTSVASM
eukprot:g1488.t1